MRSSRKEALHRLIWRSHCLFERLASSGSGVFDLYEALQMYSLDFLMRSTTCLRFARACDEAIEEATMTSVLEALGNTWRPCHQKLVSPSQLETPNALRNSMTSTKMRQRTTDDMTMTTFPFSLKLGEALDRKYRGSRGPRSQAFIGPRRQGRFQEEDPEVRLNEVLVKRTCSCSSDPPYRPPHEVPNGSPRLARTS